MSRSRRYQTGRRTAQAGLSLIELMISLLIGLIVVGAVLVTYLNSGVSSRNTQALSQMAEDASVALNVLRTHVAMAGYSRPTGVTTGANRVFTRAQSQAAVFGCDAAFDDLSKDIGTIACAAEGSDSIAVSYEADAGNSITNASDEPLDCLGNSLAPKLGTAPNDHYLSYSRFYVDQPEGAPSASLYCRGPGSNSAQALVENVERLEILYGITDGTTPRVARYVSAGDLTRPQFNQVLSVRICVVVASATPVMDQVTPYQACDPFAEPTSPADGDRRMFKAFTSTIVLQNRL